MASVLSDNDRIKHLIIRCGDDGPELYKRDINKLSDATAKYYSSKDATFKELMITTYIEAIENLILKSSVYATVIGLLNTTVPTFVESLTDRLVEALQKNLDKGNLLQSKSLLVLLGQLMNIGLINTFSFITVLFNLQEAADAASDKSRDFYLYLVVNTLPYVSEALNEKGAIEYKNLLDSVKPNMGKRNLSYIPVSRIFKNREDKDCLTLLWNALNEEKSRHVQNKAIEEFREQLSGVKQIKKPPKITPDGKGAKGVYRSPVSFSLFEESVVLQETNGSKLEVQVVRDQILDLFQAFKTNTKQLLGVLTTFYNDRRTPALILETIVGEALRLPSSDSKLILYATIIEGLWDLGEPFTKLTEDVFAALYSNLSNFDIECQDRAVDLLALVINNAASTWKWSLIDANTTDETKRSFNRRLFQKIFRLCSPAKLTDSLPAELKSFIGVEPQATFKYNDPNEMLQADAEIINDKLNTRVSGEELLNFLTNKTSSVESSGENLVELLANCFLYKGSKSLSHLDSHLERNAIVLTTLANDEGKQYIIINAIKSVWPNSDFHLELITDRLIHHKIVTHRSVINFAFREIERKEDEEHSYIIPFHLLENQLSKVVWRLRNLRSDIQRAKDSNELEFVSKNQIVAEQQDEEVRQLLLHVFRRFQKLLTTPGSNLKNDVIVARLKVIARRNHNEIAPIYSKLVEEFKGAGNVLEILKAVNSL